MGRKPAVKGQMTTKAKPATKKSAGKPAEASANGNAAAVAPSDQSSAWTTEIVELASLQPHPRNYRTHPDDELNHIAESIRANGLYKNIVVARDGTILAGHGVTKALLKLGHTHAPVKRLDIAPDDPQALKILVGDNEIAHLVEMHDRELTEILKECMTNNITGLLGTGFDDSMLATLAMVTRPASEIADIDEAKEWAGMPEYGDAAKILKVVVSFKTKADRNKFAKILGLELPDRETASTWYPPKAKEDLDSKRFKG
jgi:hypothetical protein